MKDFLIVFPHFGINVDKSVINSILKKANLLSESEFIGNLVSIKIPFGDKRIEALSDEMKLRGFNDKPLIRFEREFTKAEIENAPLLRLQLKTARLDNPKKEQLYDRSHICPKCGAGLEVIPPLLIPKNDMGKKKIDFTAHHHWMIIEKPLANKIIECGLTGIEFQTAYLGRNLTDFYYAKITNRMPPFSSKSKYQISEPCDLCNNSGRYDNYSQPTEFIYNQLDIEMCGLQDFNKTFEYFGYWGHSKEGGGQLLIVSQKVRELFKNEKVRFTKFVPVYFI